MARKRQIKKVSRVITPEVTKRPTKKTLNKHYISTEEKIYRDVLKQARRKIKEVDSTKFKGQIPIVKEVKSILRKYRSEGMPDKSTKASAFSRIAKMMDIDIKEMAKEMASDMLRWESIGIDISQLKNFNYFLFKEFLQYVIEKLNVSPSDSETIMNLWNAKEDNIDIEDLMSTLGSKSTFNEMYKDFKPSKYRKEAYDSKAFIRNIRYHKSKKDE